MAVHGLKEVLQNIGRANDKIKANVTEAMQATQAAIVNDAKTNHPYTDRTGFLTSSIGPGKTSIGRDKVTFEVVADAHYAKYLEGDPERGKPGIGGGKYAFLIPAIMRQRNKFRTRVLNAIKEVA